MSTNRHRIGDGGAAFPRPYSHTNEGNDRLTSPAMAGMSLLDYLAGQALAGMLAHPTRYKPRPGAPANWHDAIAQEAYELGAAMLATRSSNMRAEA